MEANAKPTDDGDVVTAKATAMVVLCCASLIMGLLPLKLSSWLGWAQQPNPKNNGFVSALLALGGGVLLCTTFIHLLPEVSENVETLVAHGQLEELAFPLAQTLMCIGFFAMYLVEEVAHWHVHRHEARRKRASLADQVLHRTLSIRRSDRGCETSCETTGDGATSGAPIAVVTTTATTDQTKANALNHNHGHSHGHSHIPMGTDEDDVLVSGLRGLLVVLALSVHELFEGLAVGLEPSAAYVWYLFGAVAAHKLVIAFCIGVELVTAGTRPLLTVAYVALFAVVSPLGIGIGLGLTHSGSAHLDMASVFLQGLACGTLLYVVFFEILQRERTEGFRQMLAVMAGFALMFLLQSLTDHDHGSEDDHGHDHHDHGAT